jgi:hypothetical protein
MSSLEALAAAARAALHTPNVPAVARLKPRPEGPPEIRSRHPDQADRHRETADHRIRARLLGAGAAPATPDDTDGDG